MALKCRKCQKVTKQKKVDKVSVTKPHRCAGCGGIDFEEIMDTADLTYDFMETVFFFAGVDDISTEEMEPVEVASDAAMEDDSRYNSSSDDSGSSSFESDSSSFDSGSSDCGGCD